MIYRRIVYLFILILASAGVVAQDDLTEFKVNPAVTDVAVPEFKDDSAKVKKRPVRPPKEIVPLKAKPIDSTDVVGKNKTMIYLERADYISFDQDVRPDAQLLQGNVIMRHDDAYLYCDSAYFMQKDNSFNAYGNVRIEQGDSIFVYGRVLYYDGNTKLARLRKDVRMINGEVTLTSDSLNYNRNTNVGYYFGGGEIKDSLNTLVSEKGYYYADTKEADFRYNVVGTNKDFILYSDTLKYNTDTKIAGIVGPTTIDYKKDTKIYSELGWYDTNTQKSELLKNSTVTQDDGKQLKGDTIYYDKLAGTGRAYSNVQLNDTSKSISLYGHYGYYQEEGDIALVTDSALMVEYSSEDTLYLNADTLYSFEYDSTNIVLAYYGVRIFRNDLQAVCDSMMYTSADSVLTMMQRPIMWSDNQQLNGDTIRVFFSDGKMDYMHVIENAFMSQKEDSIYFNQMSGKEILCYMGDSTLRQVDVNGNAESIYFPVDEGEFIGMNTIQSSYMNIYFEDGKIERLVVHPQPTASMLPMNMVGEDNMHLLNFSWMESLRPKSPMDVFDRPVLDDDEDPELQRQMILEMEKQKREAERQKRKADAQKRGTKNDSKEEQYR